MTKPKPQPFAYFGGQKNYLERVACKDFALIAADVGTGKTLFALSLIQAKLGNPIKGRVLIIAPQATLRGDDIEEGDEAEEESVHTLSQWRQEIQRYAPGVPVHELYTWEDYIALATQHTALPYGIYLTYYESAFRNKAQERLPDTWNHARLCKAFQTDLGLTFMQFYCVIEKRWDYGVERRNWYTEGDLMLTPEAAKQIKIGDSLVHDNRTMIVEKLSETPVFDYTEACGEERNGVRCISAPCLMTRIDMDYQLFREPTDPPNPFDMICLDESHIACHLSAQVSQSLIRMQAKYRYAFTATPIPNIVSDMFPILGWICCPDWYKGKIRNAAWPYAVDEIERFKATFQSEERDYTQEAANSKKNPRWSGKCTKVSPVISSPARLLKLIKPTLAFISKEQCVQPMSISSASSEEPKMDTPILQPCKVVDIRVQMGLAQAKLYAHYLNRANIPGKNALVRARTQVAYLRGVCADPKGRFGCASNWNPKTIAIMELVRDILGRGEQVLIVNARIGQSDEIARRLKEAGITYSRIDSTVLAKDQSRESNRFKQGEVPVMLMGIKCARGFSFDECPNEIIGSLEYSYGSLHQAKGRVWRVNSKYPVTVYCVLHKNSIEESMFDLVSLKQDSATLCLYGQRVPRDFKPFDLGEILADTIAKFDVEGRDETECETDWPALCDALSDAHFAWMRRQLEEPAPEPEPEPEQKIVHVNFKPVFTIPDWIKRMLPTNQPKTI